jgi:dimeric dUTPase (all-alpha-NTP-PPase superfamily)
MTLSLLCFFFDGILPQSVIVSFFFCVMMDKLDTLLEMQRELSLELMTDRYPSMVQERIELLSTAIIHEAIELQRLTNWKWWKKPVGFDTENAKEELIDIWHFMLQASIELGMTSDDILSYYSRKNIVNKERKKNNY